MSPDLTQVIATLLPLFGIIFPPIATYILSRRLNRDRLKLEEEEITTRDRQGLNDDTFLNAFNGLKDKYDALEREYVRLQVKNIQLQTELNQRGISQ